MIVVYDILEIVRFYFIEFSKKCLFNYYVCEDWKIDFDFDVCIMFDLLDCFGFILVSDFSRGFFVWLN